MMAPPKKKTVTTGTMIESEPTAPRTSRQNEKTLPPIQGQTSPEPRTETLEDTTQQELVAEPTLAEVLAQYKGMEKALK
jgi:hypothetical protein